MIPSLSILVVLALAAFRATRLVAEDTISDPFRSRLFRWAWDDENLVDDGHGHQVPTARTRHGAADERRLFDGWRTWVWMLFTCQWCLGVWISTAVYCAWRWGGDVALSILAVLAIAGLQGAVAQFVTSAHEAIDE